MAKAVIIPRASVAVACLLALVGSGCFQAPVLRANGALLLWQGMNATTDASGDSAPITGPRLQLKEAQSLSQRCNASLRSLRAGLPISEAELSIAGQVPNPQFRLSEMALDDMLDGSPTMEVAFRFRFDGPGERAGRELVAAWEHRTLLARIAQSEQRVAHDVERGYGSLDLVATELGVIEREITLRTQHVSMVEERVTAGVGVALDIALAKLPLARALDTRAALRNRRLGIEAQLALLIGVGSGARFDLTDAFQTMGELPQQSTEALVAQAMAARPELREAAARVVQAKTRSEVARLARIPWPRFSQVAYEIRDPLQPKRFSVAVGIEVPLFHWQTDRITLRDAEVKRAQLREEAAVRRVGHEVLEAIARAKGLKARLTLSEAQLLRAAEEGAEALAQAQNAGVVVPLRATLVAERRLRAQRLHMRTAAAYREALLDLRAALGRVPTPKPPARTTTTTRCQRLRN